MKISLGLISSQQTEGNKYFQQVLSSSSLPFVVNCCVVFLVTDYVKNWLLKHFQITLKAFVDLSSLPTLGSYPLCSQFVLIVVSHLMYLYAFYKMNLCFILILTYYIEYTSIQLTIFTIAFHSKFLASNFVLCNIY